MTVHYDTVPRGSARPTRRNPSPSNGPVAKHAATCSNPVVQERAGAGAAGRPMERGSGQASTELVRRAFVRYDHPMPRAIIHLDLDAFYCAVEELRTPALRGQPFAVGGSPAGRGVIASCSYAARAFGVHNFSGHLVPCRYNGRTRPVTQGSIQSRAKTVSGMVFPGINSIQQPHRDARACRNRNRLG